MKLFGFTHWWEFAVIVQKKALFRRRFSCGRHFMEFFRIWKKRVKKLLMKKGGFKPEFSRFILCLRKFLFKISANLVMLLTKYQIWRSHENNLKIWDFTQSKMNDFLGGIWKKKRKILYYPSFQRGVDFSSYLHNCWSHL